MRIVKSLDQVQEMANKAVDRKTPITITYVREDGSETIRTIEPFEIKETKAGNLIMKAMDRETEMVRSWRLDRIQSYTVHRTAFLVAPYESVTKAVEVVNVQANYTEEEGTDMRARRVDTIRKGEIVRDPNGSEVKVKNTSINTRVFSGEPVLVMTIEGIQQGGMPYSRVATLNERWFSA